MAKVSPKLDDCFKGMFRNETVRKYFISAVLSIPVEQIKSVKLKNTELWRAYRKQKLGILDVVIELEDDTKIDIELQIRRKKDWEKRQIYYLTKMYTADLLAGHKYDRLKRCVLISITDYNLDEAEEYHHIYRLRDEAGREFSDLLEIHTLELKKKLKGTDPMDDWIRVFNAETVEELRMIKTENIGIVEAIRELTAMSLTKRMRLLYEARQKSIRDRMAEDDYVREEGRMEGIRDEREQGIRMLIETCREVGLTRKDILGKLQDKYELEAAVAEEYLAKF